MQKVVALVLLVTVCKAAPPEDVNPPAGPHNIECNETQPCGDGGMCLPVVNAHPSSNGLGSLVCVNMSGIQDCPDPNSNQLCGGVDLTDPAMICDHYMQGTSPYCPSCNYTTGSEMVTFIAPAGMQVQMSMDVLGIQCTAACDYDCALGTTSCTSDYVFVFDKGSNPMAKICGGGFTYNYTSTFGSITLHTTTNYLCNDGKGFVATIQYV